MGSTKPESSASSNLALVACAMVGTLALSVPATALLMHYFSSNIEPGNATMQMARTSEDSNMEALRNGWLRSWMDGCSKASYDLPTALEIPVFDHSTIFSSDLVFFPVELNFSEKYRQLLGMDPNNINSLGWENRHNENFPHLVDKSQSLSLIIPQSGFYYVYYQVGFRGSHCKNDRSQLTLHSQVFHKHESYPDEHIILLEGMETVCGQVNSSEMWYTSVSQGRLVQLQQYHCLFVTVSHPELVDYDEGKTYFGVMMVS